MTLYIISAILILFAALFIWGVMSGRRLLTREYSIPLRKTAEGLAGLKIVQISDLHCASYGKSQGALIAAIRRAAPDMIVITGDLFDRHRPFVQEPAYELVFAAVKIAPCFYVNGNHETAMAESPAREKELAQMGVRVLRNESCDITANGVSFRIIGLNENAKPQQWTMLVNSSRFHLLLSHRPEKFDEYAAAGVDLALTGHAHGGQIRILGQGIFAPEQGVFPKYNHGIYTSRRTKMIVSTGLGNTKYALRLFNPRELVSVTLVK